MQIVVNLGAQTGRAVSNLLFVCFKFRGDLRAPDYLYEIVLLRMVNKTVCKLVRLSSAPSIDAFVELFSKADRSLQSCLARVLQTL